MKNLNPLRPLALAVIIAVTFTACRKKERVEVNFPQLQKVESSNGNYLSMSYNADQTISKITSLEDGFTSEMLITYDTEKKPIQANAGTHQLKLLYETGKLKRINVVSPENQALTGFMQFGYANNRLSETIISANINGNIVGETKLAYEYDANGNVKQTTVIGLDPADGTWSVFSIHRFEYDQRTNPLLSASVFFAGIDWNPSANNVTKEVVMSAAEVVQETITTIYSYDPKTGMPLTATETTQPVGGDASIITKKFIYK